MEVKQIQGEFKATKQADKSVTIEGWANKAVVDDVGDLLKFDQVDMERFKKNPIMFFNHDRDLPVGKFIETKLSPEGLWVKGVISNSTNKIVSYVRDLVAEGILKTFSIGFEIKDEQKSGEANVINKWRLNEISVVTLPCNTEAEFSLAKQLGEEYTVSKLRLKGAHVAAELAKKPMSEEQLAALAEKLSMQVEDLQKIVRGEVTPVPEEVLQKLSEALGLSLEGLMLLNKADYELEGEGEPEPEAEPEAEPEMPESDVEGQCKPKKPEEKENSFQECVAQKIPKLIEEGKTQEQAVAIAMSMCSEEGKCHINDITEEMLQFAKNLAAESQPLPKQDPTDFGNPYMEIAKSQLALLGKLSAQMDQMIALMQPKQEPKPQEDAPPTPPLANESQLADNKEDVNEIKIISDRIKGMIEEINNNYHGG